MPKINPGTVEQSVNQILETTVATHQKIVTTTEPVLTVAVGRKVNIGNFENVDLFACLTTSISGVSPSDKEAFSEAIKEAASYAFSLVSKETGERYTLIKEAQQGKN